MKKILVWVREIFCVVYLLFAGVEGFLCLLTLPLNIIDRCMLSLLFVIGPIIGLYSLIVGNIKLRFGSEVNKITSPIRFYLIILIFGFFGFSIGLLQSFG